MLFGVTLPKWVKSQLKIVSGVFRTLWWARTLWRKKAVHAKAYAHGFFSSEASWSWWIWYQLMMTSSNGNIFRVTGPLWGESIGYRWISLTKTSDARSFDVLFDVHLNKQWRCRRFETPWRSLWHHCNVHAGMLLFASDRFTKPKSILSLAFQVNREVTMKYISKQNQINDGCWRMHLRFRQQNTGHFILRPFRLTMLQTNTFFIFADALASIS